jgi:hypothetical protein
LCAAVEGRCIVFALAPQIAKPKPLIVNVVVIAAGRCQPGIGDRSDGCLQIARVNCNDTEPAIGLRPGTAGNLIGYALTNLPA